MQISPIVSGIHSPAPIRGIHAAAPPVRAAAESFGSVLAEAIQRLQVTPAASQIVATSGVAASQSASSLQSLAALQSLGSSVPLATQLTTQAVAAYQQIMGMQL